MYRVGQMSQVNIHYAVDTLNDVLKFRLGPLEYCYTNGKIKLSHMTVQYLQKTYFGVFKLELAMDESLKVIQVFKRFANRFLSQKRGSRFFSYSFFFFLFLFYFFISCLLHNCAEFVPLSFVLSLIN